MVSSNLVREHFGFCKQNFYMSGTKTSWDDKFYVPCYWTKILSRTSVVRKQCYKKIPLIWPDCVQLVLLAFKRKSTHKDSYYNMTMKAYAVKLYRFDLAKLYYHFTLGHQQYGRHWADGNIKYFLVKENFCVIKSLYKCYINDYVSVGLIDKTINHWFRLWCITSFTSELQPWMPYIDQ